MPDISELIIEVKNTKNAINEIKKVDNALKSTQKTATSLGKGIFATWTFTKVVQGAKMMGDAFKESLISLRNFDVLYGRMNHVAERSIKSLQNTFGETEVSAKKLLNLIGSRTFEFNFNFKQFSKLNSEIADASSHLASFFQIRSEEAVDIITRSLYGMTKGLSRFGVLIDTSSDSFKKEVEQLKLYQGLSEKAASALVIWSKAREQLKKFQGANVEEAKTLSKAIDNISQTLKTGIFASAGEILSKTFVPILNKINEALSKPWVQKIGGIVLALGGVLIAIKSITVAMKSLQFVLGSINALSLGGGLFSGIGTLVKGFILKGVASFTSALAAGSGLIGAAIAGWPLTITAAAITALTAAGVMLAAKISTGDWLNFSGLAEKFYQGIQNFFERVVNYVEIGKFDTHDEIVNNTAEKVKAAIKTYEINFTLISKEFKRLSKIIDQSNFKFIDKKFIEDYKKVIDQSTKLKDKLKFYKEKLDSEKEYFESLNSIVKDLNDAILRGDKQITLRAGKTSKTIKGAFQIKKALDIMKEYRDASSRNMASYSEMYEKIEKEMNGSLKELQQRFENLSEENEKLTKENEYRIEKARREFEKFLSSLNDNLDLKNWWEKLNEDFLKLKFNGSPISQQKILSSIKERVKNITEFIQKIENEIKKQLLLPEDEKDQEKIKVLEQLRLEKQKEIVDLIKDEMNVKLDGLKREEEIIKDTNDMILDYARKALEFKQSGSEVIKSGTMEEMRFITSSLAPIGTLENVIKTSNDKAAQLDQKRNSILIDSKNILNKIKDTLEKNQGIQLNAISI